MTSLPKLAEAISELRFTGELLQPGEAGYDAARRVHNGMVDKRPALIARCRGAADVVDAVLLARNLGLEAAVRGGGHNVAGRATVDGGLMIDLAAMRGVHVDPRARTVRAEGGVTWGDLNRETQLHGLAVTGGVVSTTGVAGLTLGGGLGWLMSKYGLALDNLLSVDLVLANGELATASPHENADLFWAVRGGGGNFGVATSFEFALHPVGPAIIGGLIAHPFAQAGEMLRFYRAQTAALPDEHTLFAGLIHSPDGAKLAAMVTAHCGPLAEAEAAMQPLKEFGAAALDTVGPLPYCQLNSMLDGAYPKGALNYWKSSFLAELSEAAIDTMVEAYANCPTPMGQLLVEHFHGAATRIGLADTAFPLRREGYNFLIVGQWLDGAQSEACIAWVRQTYAAMQPFVSRDRYVNYLDDDDTGDPVAAAYGPNYRRLQQLKATYDPGNFFHLNQNIRPLA
ncbi:MAG: FAD-binding oxidoreductase [Thiohalocapsa sp.]